MKLATKILSSLTSLAMVAGLGYLATIPSQQLLANAPSAISVSTTALPLEIYCPGPVAELGGEDGTELGSLALVGKATVVSHIGTSVLSSIIPDQLESGTPIVLETPDQTTNALSAIQTQVLKRSRMQGVAAGYCGQPTPIGYFVSGMGSLGRESILHLANPGENEVQISLRVYTLGGGAQKLVTLASFEQVQVSMAALATNEPSYAVSFESNGAGISAFLQNRTSSGLAATGVELVEASQPATDQFIAGLTIFADQFEQPILKVFNPSDQELAARVILHGVGVDSDVFEINLPPRVLTEKALNLSLGEYLVEVSSKEPVVSGVWTSKLGKILDFAWLTPASTFEDSATLPVPELQTELVIANPADAPISVSVLNAGQYQSLTIAAKSSSRISVQVPEVQVQSPQQFMLSMQIVGDAGYAAINPTENRNLGSDVEVFVR